MKKVLSILLAVCLLVGCMPLAASAEAASGATISKIGENAKVTALVGSDNSTDSLLGDVADGGKTISVNADATIPYTAERVDTPAGNYVWVKISLPTGFTTSDCSITFDGDKTLTEAGLDDTDDTAGVDAILWHALITKDHLLAGKREVTVAWDASTTDTFTIKLPDTVKLANADGSATGIRTDATLGTTPADVAGDYPNPNTVSISEDQKTIIVGSGVLPYVSERDDTEDGHYLWTRIKLDTSKLSDWDYIQVGENDPIEKWANISSDSNLDWHQKISSLTPSPRKLVVSYYKRSGEDATLVYKDSFNINLSGTTLAYHSTSTLDDVNDAGIVGDYGTDGIMTPSSPLNKKIVVKGEIPYVAQGVDANTPAGNYLWMKATLVPGDLDYDTVEFAGHTYDKSTIESDPVFYIHQSITAADITAKTKTVEFVYKKGEDAVYTDKFIIDLEGASLAAPSQPTTPAPAEKTNLSTATVTVSGTHTYTGSAITPDVTVKVGETTLTKDTDYTVSYSDNTNAGTATVTVTAKNDSTTYTGSKSANFTIAKKAITITAKDQTIDEGGTINSAASQVTVTGGLATGEQLGSVTLTVSGTAIEPSAAAIFNAGKTETTSNYTITYVNGTLTVNSTPATLTTQSTIGKVGDTTITGNYDTDGLLTINDRTVTVTGTVPYIAGTEEDAPNTPAGNYVWVKLTIDTTADFATVKLGDGAKYTQTKTQVEEDNTLYLHQKVTAQGAEIVLNFYDSSNNLVAKDTFTIDCSNATLATEGSGSEGGSGSGSGSGSEGGSGSGSGSGSGGGSTVTPTPDEPETPSTPSDETPKTETVTADDGTTTTTATWSDGKTSTTVKTPEGNVTTTVTSPSGETIATIDLPADPGAGKEFDDVKGWSENAIEQATAYGLFSGESETTFNPKGDMTRGMVAQVLYNLSGKPGYGVGEGNFGDTDGYYSNAIDWAAKTGVASGNGNGTFTPDDSVTREQLVTMLYNFAKAIGATGSTTGSVSGFPDGGDTSSWAAEAMGWAVANGLISGSADGGATYLNPKDAATREQVASVMVKFVQFLTK